MNYTNTNLEDIRAVASQTLDAQTKYNAKNDETNDK